MDYITTINKIGSEDQTLRELYAKGKIKDFNIIKSADAKHILLLKKIINKIGLIAPPKFNEETAKYAFLIVQHSNDLKFMKHYLQLLKKANTLFPYIAYLDDRISLIEKKPQKYGTQKLFNNATKVQSLYKIDDINKVNIRRQKLGLKKIIL